MQFIESKDLKPGMRLAKPVYNKMGVLLYDRNSYLTRSGIKSIENFGLIGLFILEPAEPLPPISQEDIQFEQFQTIYMFRIKEIMDRLQKDQAPETLSDLADNILSHYGSLDHKMNFTQTLRSSVDFVYKHAISTAMLSAMIANVMGYTNIEKTQLITAALLYDLGYLYVPRNILDKKDDLTEEDYLVIAESRRKGYQLLYPDINKYLLSSDVLKIIQQTHMILNSADGEDLKDKNLSSSAWLLAVADKFDQLTAMNLHHAPVSEVAAIRQLKMHPEFYKPQIVSALADCIHILPSGCSLDLSTGDKGIVLEDNPDNFLAPVVLNIRTNQIYDLSDPNVAQEVQIVDIMKTMDNRIVIDEDTLHHFSADSTLQNRLAKYKKRKEKLFAKYLK